MKKQAFYHGVVDDTAPVYSIGSVDLIETVINHDLHELNSRSSKWLMSHKPEHYILWFVLIMLIPTNFFIITLNLLKCLSHRKPCKIQKNVTKVISVRKKSYTFSKYLMPSIL